MIKFLLLVIFANWTTAANIRGKRTIYYDDIPLRPQPFRSRAEEKEKADIERQRTGNLPLEPSYPSSIPKLPDSLSERPQEHAVPHSTSLDLSIQSVGHFPIERPISIHEPTYQARPDPPIKRKLPKVNYPSQRPHSNKLHNRPNSYSVSPPRKSLHKKKHKSPIPGVAGKDYPIFHKVPATRFSCKDVPYRPGMYANIEAGCQAYHVCNDERHGPQGAGFLCTNGTLFNQESFSCDWWYNVDCSKAQGYYKLNSDPEHNPYFQKSYEEIKGSEFPATYPKKTKQSSAYSSHRETYPYRHRQSESISHPEHSKKPSFIPAKYSPPISKFAPENTAHAPFRTHRPKLGISSVTFNSNNAPAIKPHTLTRTFGSGNIPYGALSFKPKGFSGTRHSSQKVPKRHSLIKPQSISAAQNIRVVPKRRSPYKTQTTSAIHNIRRVPDRQSSNKVQSTFAVHDKRRAPERRTQIKTQGTYAVHSLGRPVIKQQSNSGAYMIQKMPEKHSSVNPQSSYRKRLHENLSIPLKTPKEQRNSQSEHKILPKFQDVKQQETTDFEWGQKII